MLITEHVLFVLCACHVVGFDKSKLVARRLLTLCLCSFSIETPPVLRDIDRTPERKRRPVSRCRQLERDEHKKSGFYKVIFNIECELRYIIYHVDTLGLTTHSTNIVCI